MTSLLLAVLAIFAAYAVYIAALSARRAARPDDHLDGGGALPAWTYVFAATGVVIAGLGLHDHVLLIALNGLQYSHVALGLVLVALCGVMVQGRVWAASRITGVRSPVELFGAYYDSVAIRLFLLAVLTLFAVPFAAAALATLGTLIETATGGAVMAAPAIWASAVFLFLVPVIGGWRGMVYAVAGQSVLLLALLLFAGAFPAVSGGDFLGAGIATPQGVLADAIPGVVQYSAGIGKDVVTGGIWTTLGILSFAVSLIGIVLSPGFSLLGITAASRSGFAFNPVWMTAGLGGGLLLLLGPVLGAGVAAADPAGLAAAPSFAGLIARVASFDVMAGVCLVLLLAIPLQIAVAFFATAGASIATLDVVGRYLLPELAGDGRRLAARITLAAIFATVACLATFAPALAAIAASVTLSLSAQLLPAFLGLCWVPWIGRSAVVTGLIAGSLLVVFTEPPGLLAFEGLFVGLPWGRWPLTIHSAAWGLAFNITACLIVSAVTRAGPERAHRQRLHDAYARAFPPSAAPGDGVGAARWSLPLIWAFFALGPGAILGNDVFRHPVFTDAEAPLGVPSLWVWQIMSWLAGVLLVWWLAYGGQARSNVAVARTVDFAPARGPLGPPPTPAWLGRVLSRVAER